MYIENKYEVCQLSDYKINYENSKKANHNIEKISKILLSDLQLHERLHKNDNLKLSIDIDKFRKHYPSLTLEKIFNDICQFLNVQESDICYTTTFSVESGSHHLVIAKYYLVSSKQKILWKTFKSKYNYGKEIDSDIFDKEGWFRLPNQTKECVQNTQHIIQKGEVADFVLKYIPVNCIEYKMKNINEAIPTIPLVVGAPVGRGHTPQDNEFENKFVNDIPDKEQKEDKYIDLLFNVIKNEKDCKNSKIISWDNWFKIAGVFKHNKYEFKTFYEYSKPFATMKDCEKLWNSIKNEKTMSIFVLESIAKEINYTSYKKWKFSKNEPMFNELIKQPADENFAKLFYEYHGDDFLYNNDVVYYFNGLYWTETKTDLRRTYTTKFIKVMDELLLFETKKLIKLEPSSDEHETQRKRIKYINDIIFTMKSNKNINAVCKDAILPYIENNNIQFEHNPYIICFDNVVFNLKTFEFVKPDKYDFMNLSTSYHWKEPTDEEIYELETIIKKYYLKKTLETHMTLLSTGLCGETLERLF
jgi:hypothetical protein